MSIEANYIVKICLLGEANVGKTSLVYRFIENKFRGNYKSTLGVNLLKKDVKIEKFGDVSAQIWDLGGQESFRSLRKLYLEGANGALVIYDSTKRSSFEKLYDWIQDFKDARGDEEDSEALELAQNYSMEFISTSAKTGTNVEEAFLRVIKTILGKSL